MKKQILTTKKENKGITLIALVITIIVLLILAGVSIAMLTGENGILTQANTAKDKTERAEIIERAQTDILGEQAGNNGDISKEKVNDIIAKYDKEGKIRDDKDEAYIVTDKGYEIKVSDIWSGTTSTGGTLAKDVLKTDSTATEASNKSPYVKYNGLDCRVLYNDDTHGLQIITANSVENVTLGYGDNTGADVKALDFTYSGSATVNDNFKKAAVSYNNVVDNLNNKAKTYMDTKGIATDARCLGSMPTLNSNSKFQGDTSGMWTGSYDYLTTYDWNNKFKTTDTNYLEDVSQLNSLGLNVSSGYTWLASRFVNSYSRYAYFYVRIVNSGGSTSYYDLCYVYSGGTASSSAPSYGFRPVFFLSSNVVISSGDGTIGNPYNIE